MRSRAVQVLLDTIDWSWKDELEISELLEELEQVTNVNFKTYKGLTDLMEQMITDNTIFNPLEVKKILKEQIEMNKIIKDLGVKQC